MRTRVRDAYVRARNLVRQRPGAYADDDFDWRTYNTEYRRELTDVEAQHLVQMQPGDYVFTDGRLDRGTASLPLHPNHRLLYETVLQLAPASVVEAGCGAGYHLENLSVLRPGLVVSGFDRSEQQLEFLRERYPELRPHTSVLDLTLPAPRSMTPADVAFTQAVLMHIRTGNNHLVALANLFSMATQQVVLMENWLNHDFLGDIQRLQRDAILPWESVHTYVRRSPELDGRPHLMVVSRETLDLEPLEDYEVLVGPLAPTGRRHSPRR